MHKFNVRRLILDILYSAFMTWLKLKAMSAEDYLLMSRFFFGFRFHWERGHIKQGQAIRVRQQAICAMLENDQTGQVRIQKLHHLDIIVTSSDRFVFIAKAKHFGQSNKIWSSRNTPSLRSLSSGLETRLLIQNTVICSHNYYRNILANWRILVAEWIVPLMFSHARPFNFIFSNLVLSFKMANTGNYCLVMWL